MSDKPNTTQPMSDEDYAAIWAKMNPGVPLPGKSESPAAKYAYWPDQAQNKKSPVLSEPPSRRGVGFLGPSEGTNTNLTSSSTPSTPNTVAPFQNKYSGFGELHEQEAHEKLPDTAAEPFQLPAEPKIRTRDMSGDYSRSPLLSGEELAQRQEDLRYKAATAPQREQETQDKFQAAYNEFDKFKRDIGLNTSDPHVSLTVDDNGRITANMADISRRLQYQIQDQAAQNAGFHDWMSMKDDYASQHGFQNYSVMPDNHKDTINAMQNQFSNQAQTEAAKRINLALSSAKHFGITDTDPNKTNQQLAHLWPGVREIAATLAPESDVFITGDKEEHARGTDRDYDITNQAGGILRVQNAEPVRITDRLMAVLGAYPAALSAASSNLNKVMPQAQAAMDNGDYTKAYAIELKAFLGVDTPLPLLEDRVAQLRQNKQLAQYWADFAGKEAAKQILGDPSLTDEEKQSYISHWQMAGLAFGLGQDFIAPEPVSPALGAVGKGIKSVVSSEKYLLNTAGTIRAIERTADEGTDAAKALRQLKAVNPAAEAALQAEIAVDMSRTGSDLAGKLSDLDKQAAEAKAIGDKLRKELGTITGVDEMRAATTAEDRAASNLEAAKTTAQTNTANAEREAALRQQIKEADVASAEAQMKKAELERIDLEQRAAAAKQAAADYAKGEGQLPKATAKVQQALKEAIEREFQTAAAHQEMLDRHMPAVKEYNDSAQTLMTQEARLSEAQARVEKAKNARIAAMNSLKERVEEALAKKNAAQMASDVKGLRDAETEIAELKKVNQSLRDATHPINLELDAAKADLEKELAARKTMRASHKEITRQAAIKADMMSDTERAYAEAMSKREMLQFQLESMGVGASGEHPAAAIAKQLSEEAARAKAAAKFARGVYIQAVSDVGTENKELRALLSANKQDIAIVAEAGRENVGKAKGVHKAAQALAEEKIKEAQDLAASIGNETRTQDAATRWRTIFQSYAERIERGVAAAHKLPTKPEGFQDILKTATVTSAKRSGARAVDMERLATAIDEKFGLDAHKWLLTSELPEAQLYREKLMLQRKAGLDAIALRPNEVATLQKLDELGYRAARFGHADKDAMDLVQSLELIDKWDNTFRTRGSYVDKAMQSIRRTFRAYSPLLADAGYGHLTSEIGPANRPVQEVFKVARNIAAQSTDELMSIARHANMHMLDPETVERVKAAMLFEESQVGTLRRWFNQRARGYFMSENDKKISTIAGLVQWIDTTKPTPYFGGYSFMNRLHQGEPIWSVIRRQLLSDPRVETWGKKLREYDEALDAYKAEVETARVNGRQPKLDMPEYPTPSAEQRETAPAMLGLAYAWSPTDNSLHVPEATRSVLYRKAVELLAQNEAEGKTFLDFMLDMKKITQLPTEAGGLGAIELGTSRAFGLAAGSVSHALTQKMALDLMANATAGVFTEQQLADVVAFQAGNLGSVTDMENVRRYYNTMGMPITQYSEKSFETTGGSTREVSRKVSAIAGREVPPADTIGHIATIPTEPLPSMSEHFAPNWGELGKPVGDPNELHRLWDILDEENVPWDQRPKWRAVDNLTTPKTHDEEMAREYGKMLERTIGDGIKADKLAGILKTSAVDPVVREIFARAEESLADYDVSLVADGRARVDAFNIYLEGFTKNRSMNYLDLPRSLFYSHISDELTVAHEFVHALTLWAIEDRESPAGKALNSGIAQIMSQTTWEDMAKIQWTEEEKLEFNQLVNDRFALWQRATPRATNADLNYYVRTMFNYYTKNAHEFVAGAFTDPVFQYLLKKMPTDSYVSPAKSKWDQFVRTVCNILGFRQKDVNRLSDIIRYGGRAMESNDFKLFGRRIGVWDVDYSLPRRAVEALNPTRLIDVEANTSTEGGKILMSKKLSEAIDRNMPSVVKEMDARYVPGRPMAIDKLDLAHSALVHLWKSSSTTGLGLPHASYWLNNICGDLSQMWFSLDGATAAKQSFINLPANIPFFGRYWQDYGGKLAEWGEGKPVLGPIFGALFNPHLNQVWNGKEGSILTAAGEVIPFDQARRELIEGGILDTVVHEELPNAFTRTRGGMDQKWYEWAATKGKDALTDYHDSVSHFASFVQQRQRSGLYLTLRKQGMTAAEARTKTLEALFDWKNGVAQREVQAFASWMPYYRFWRLAYNQSILAFTEPLLVPEKGIAGLLADSRLARLRNQIHGFDTMASVPYFVSGQMAKKYVDTQSQYDDTSAFIRPDWARDRGVLSAYKTEERRMRLLQAMKGKVYNGQMLISPSWTAIDLATMNCAILGGMAAIANSVAGNPTRFKNSPDAVETFWSPISGTLFPWIQEAMDPLVHDYTDDPLAVDEGSSMKVTAGEAKILNAMSNTPHTWLGKDGNMRAARGEVAALRMLPLIHSEIVKPYDAIFGENPEMQQAYKNRLQRQKLFLEAESAPPELAAKLRAQAESLAPTSSTQLSQLAEGMLYFTSKWAGIGPYNYNDIDIMDQRRTDAKKAMTALLQENDMTDKQPERETLQQDLLPGQKPE